MPQQQQTKPNGHAHAPVTSYAVDRIFTIEPAVRKRVPLWIALNSPSGGGKTKSALRLAAGAQRVVGGKVHVVDTENDRALHYADWFKETYGYEFNHVHFDPPFGSLHYLAAILQCIRDGATVIVTDSMSHEHDGIGGLLEQHEEEIDRLQNEQHARTDGKYVSGRDELSGSAWKLPKMNRRRMINEIMQAKAIFIFCFRAKPKQDFSAKGKDRDLGNMPVSGDDLLFEMTVSANLPALSEGTPDWDPKKRGERSMVKKGPFKKLFERPRQLDEEIGAAMAQWAVGSSVPTPSAAASHGTASERSAIIKDLGAIRQKLKWSLDKSKEWRRATFGSDEVAKLSVQQLDDARTLLALLLDNGEEAYQAELATLVELGRAIGPEGSEAQA